MKSTWAVGQEKASPDPSSVAYRLCDLRQVA